MQSDRIHFLAPLQFSIPMLGSEIKRRIPCKINALADDKVAVEYNRFETINEIGRQQDVAIQVYLAIKASVPGGMFRDSGEIRNSPRIPPDVRNMKGSKTSGLLLDSSPLPIHDYFNIGPETAPVIQGIQLESCGIP